MEYKFKIGDRVKVIGNDEGLLNKIGTITFIDNDNVPYLVEFDEEVPFGHDGGNRKGKDGHCLFFREHDLKLANSKPARVIFKDNATILFKDGKKYVAKCCDGDTYDREKGLLVCLAKAHGYTFNDLQTMLAGATEVLKREETKVREIYRHAKVGEYIKIVNAAANTNKHGEGFAYKNGDILKVKELRMGGDVATYTLKGKGSNLRYFKDYNYIELKEYVVLENYKPNKYKITLSEFFKNKSNILGIHCKTKAEAKELCEAFNRVGKKWCDGDKYSAERTHWDENEEKMVYDNKGGFFSLNGYFYKRVKCKVYNFNEVDLNN